MRGKLTGRDPGAQPDFSVIRTYGKARHIEAGTVVFRRGDPVDRLYHLDTGRVLIEEIGVEISAQDICGEIAFFTDAAERTATARCLDDTRVYELDEKRFMLLQFEDPSFGMSVMRTITRRLIENARYAPQVRMPEVAQEATALQT